VRLHATYLKGAVLEVLPDVDGEVLVLLDVLLDIDLALQLCDKLIADCCAVSLGLLLS
jgi:hypothetical protein